MLRKARPELVEGLSVHIRLSVPDLEARTAAAPAVCLIAPQGCWLTLQAAVRVKETP
jgi:hypothetical protein